MMLSPGIHALEGGLDLWLPSYQQNMAKVMRCPFHNCVLYITIISVLYDGNFCPSPLTTLMNQAVMLWVILWIRCTCLRMASSGQPARNWALSPNTHKELSPTNNHFNKLGSGSFPSRVFWWDLGAAYHLSCGLGRTGGCVWEKKVKCKKSRILYKEISNTGLMLEKKKEGTIRMFFSLPQTSWCPCRPSVMLSLSFAF